LRPSPGATRDCGDDRQ
jgi:hypothetical protein